MVKRTKPSILVAILGIMLATALFFEAGSLTSSDQIRQEAKDGFKNDCRIFVKGDHAYVIRIDRSVWPGPNGYLSIFNVSGWRGDIDTITLTFTEPCYTETIPKASDVFVSGDYLYVAGLQDPDKCGLRRYDISNPCDPVPVDSAYDPTIPYSALTDMYITDDRAYLSIDPQAILVFDVSDTMEFSDRIEFRNSKQGVHVRGKYMYVANEGGGLWVCDLLDSVNYHADPPDTPYSSRDAYNVVCEGSSRTYEITVGDGFYIWNTDAPAESIPMAGSNSSESGEIVHITGNWVYWLYPPGTVKVCSLVCDDDPQLKTSYGTNLDDFHVIHDSAGHAHIYGARPHPDTTIKDSVEIWYKKTLHQGAVSPYKYGDVDGDGDVDSADLSILSSYVVDGNTVPVNLDGCDVNCDGEINTDDYHYLWNYLSHQGTPQGPPPGADCGFYHYVYGDANGDRVVNSADVTYLINYLYSGGPAPVPMAAGDPNGDCAVNSADVTYLINYLFAGGPAPRRGCAE